MTDLLPERYGPPMIPFSPEGGLMLCLARACAVGGILSVAGTSVFSLLVLPRALQRAAAAAAGPIRARLRRLAGLSTIVALLGTGLWLVAQAGDLSDAPSLAAALRAVPDVLGFTQFGHILGLQMLALLAILPALPRPRVVLGLSLVALTLQAGHSHAFAMQRGFSWLLLCDLVHLWAAGAWLGGLLPLLLVVQAGPAKTGAAAARWFSPLGKACVVATTVTAGLQGWRLVGSVSGLFGTAYGWMALVKIGLFGVLFAFALANRYRLAPALLCGDPAAATRALVRSIAVQTGFGLATVVAAAILSDLEPPPM